MVTSKKDKNNQEISRQKTPRGDPYKIRTIGKGNEHLPALIPLRRGLIKGPCLKTKTIITKDFLLSKVSDFFHMLSTYQGNLLRDIAKKTVRREEVSICILNTYVLFSVTHCL